MTTEEIRKKVEVRNWLLRSDGIIIEYSWKDKTRSFTEGKYLELNPNDAIAELHAIGEINYYGGELFEYNDQLLRWGQFINTWTFSQWDALNLVIRHELNKAMDAEIENSDIGKAVNNLLKK